MDYLSAYVAGLEALVVVAVAAWLLSLLTRDVSIVDSLWSLFFLLAAVIYAISADELSARGIAVLAMTAVWALRLSIYITARNWGEGEDYRYQAIRRKYDPNFSVKSLYIVFGLQVLLAWIISIPLLFAVTSGRTPGFIDVIGAALWLVGMIFEAGGDYQLKRFKADSANKGKVMDQGLWRYTRHPNYFGNACIWWGFYLFALADGAWWTVYAPILMTILLLKVSGVAMLERTIGDRRPGYADYISTTNAFIPGPPKMREAK